MWTAKKCLLMTASDWQVRWYNLPVIQPPRSLRTLSTLAVSTCNKSTSPVHVQTLVHHVTTHTHTVTHTHTQTRMCACDYHCVCPVICRKFELLISLGSVVTCLRWVGQCCIDFVANVIRFPVMQKVWKSVKIWQSYREFKGGNFFERQCILLSDSTADIRQETGTWCRHVK